MAAFDWTTLVGPVVSAVFSAGGVGGIWAWHAEHSKAKAAVEAASVKAKIEAPADMLEAMAAFQSALNRQAEQVTADLRQELRVYADRLATALAKIEKLEAENVQCRLESDRVRSDLSQEIQLRQSLENLLRRAGVPIPARDLPGSFVMIEGDRATVLKP